MSKKSSGIIHISIALFFLFRLPVLSQINRTVFHEDFENTSTLTDVWGPVIPYSVSTGQSGNGILFNSLTSNTNLSVYLPISITNLKGSTISISTGVKGENLMGGGLPGMVVQLVATSTSGTAFYHRIPPKTGTFDWEYIGRTIFIDSNTITLSLNVGIYNATGKLWVDNVHIQVLEEPLPPARNQTIPIVKGHAEPMLRGTNVVSNSITKGDLDELSEDWKANSIRCMIGGSKFFPGGLLLPSFDSILQSELRVMDTLVAWNTANGLRMTVGLAGLADGLFESKAMQHRLIKAWELIATRYKNAQAVQSYDLANEPVYTHKWPIDNEIKRWPSLADTLVRAIRSIDSIKPVIIESLNYSLNVNDIKPIDFSIPNVVYSVHMYAPQALTHQTLPGWVSTHSYPGMVNGKYFDKDTLKKLMKPIRDYQQKYRVPIYIGEFACIRWAPNNSAFNYIRDCIEIFEEYDWDWSFLAFRSFEPNFNGWSTEHSTEYYDQILPAIKTDREMLLRFYFQQNTVAVQAVEPENQIPSCFPNPASGEIAFPTEAQNLKGGLVDLFDARGHLIAEHKISSSGGLTRINTREMPEGLYFYKIKMPGGKTVNRGKVIIQTP